jgi:hypothetical protein
MKTAVEQLINEFNQELDVAISIANNDKIKTIKHLINIANKYLEMEKEQIKNAYEKGKKYKKPIKDSNPIWLNSKPYKDKIKYKVNNYRNNFKSE